MPVEWPPALVVRDDAPSLPSRWRRSSLLALLLVASVAAFVPASSSSVAAFQEYAGSDGCYYFWDGDSYSEKRCPQNDGSNYYFVPEGGGWTFLAECATPTAFRACLFATGVYVETYPDGSLYAEDADWRYGITHTDGTVAERGFYDAARQQHVTTVTYKKSLAMERRSQMYWAVYGIVVANIIQSNPTAFDWLRPGVQGANAYMNCLHGNDSSTDWDGDGYTGFNELAEYCTPRSR
jgi:hypothetical protein